MPVNESIGSHSEEILHFTGIRLRIVGHGNLNLQFLSLDSAESQTLAPITLPPITAREPTRLANFVSQRGSLKIFTDQLDEEFRINRIILFVKPLWTQFPG